MRSFGTVCNSLTKHVPQLEALCSTPDELAKKAQVIKRHALAQYRQAGLPYNAVAALR